MKNENVFFSDTLLKKKKRYVMITFLSNVSRTITFNIRAFHKKSFVGSVHTILLK